MRAFLDPAVAILVLLASAVAQPHYEWRRVQLGTRPFARQRHEMVYDVARSMTVLFGGFNGAHLDDTWAYDGNGWRRLNPTNRPAARADHAMAYDPVRQRVVLIGGSNGTPLTDTWEWDGSDWTRVATATAGIGADGAACYDPLQGGVFYNRAGTNLLWDGSSWSSVLVAGPVGGTRHGIVFDSATGGPLTPVIRDTKRFRVPAGWEEPFPQQPFEMAHYAIAVDPVRNRPVLQGGDGSYAGRSGEGFRETWMWTGTHWAEIALDPFWQPRSKHSMSFDLARDVFVLFGGDPNGSADYLDETWELVELSPRADFRTFGQGCSGSTSLVPRLYPEPTLNSRPVLGGSFTLRVQDIPAGQPVLMVIGLSDQGWGGMTLPLALDGFGMPGCRLYVAVDVCSAAGTSGPAGWVWWTVLVPNDHNLLGAELFHQAAVLAPGANAAGVLWSNAGAGTLGLR